MLDDSEISLLRPPVITIRHAHPRDLPELNDMIRLLAAHHGDPSATTPEQLERDLFGPVPWITALVAEGENGLIGYAILVPLYRAQEGQRGMDPHHLFVRDGHRGHGVGQHLVDRARDVALARPAAATSPSVPRPEMSRRTASTNKWISNRAPSPACAICRRSHESDQRRDRQRSSCYQRSMTIPRPAKNRSNISSGNSTFSRVAGSCPEGL